MDYPLENLTPDTFQELAQALVLREYKNVQCFPVGQADGGRDALSIYDNVSNSREREFLLFQVKFSRNPQEVKSSIQWLEASLEEEIPKVQKQVLRGAKRYILITNVRSTGTLDTGRIDATQAALDRLLPIPAQCWWREDIARRLDNAWAIKWAYPQILTGPDIIRAILESGLTEHATRRTNALRATISHQWNRDREVRFKQVELQSSLSDLFIDSPLIPRESKIDSIDELTLINIFQYMRERGVRQNTHEAHRSWPNRDTHEDRGVGAATFFLQSDVQAMSPRIVLEGAPGQGKSTVTQYLCQVHRIRLLNKTTELAALPAEHQDVPVRLPLRIDLRDFATWLARRDPFSGEPNPDMPPQWAKSLESFLAALVRHCSGGAQFEVSDLQEVARVSSLLLVFDGLDEVADIKARAAVVDELNRGLSRLHELSASLQSIITSRPAAFAKSPGMPQERYVHFKLVSLPRALIVDYAKKWGAARTMALREQAEVLRVLNEKLDMPHLRDLARNPMQLTILLSLISSRGASLPDKRTALYDAYINLFFDRESEKSPIVREYRDLIGNLHGHLAWILHSQAEVGDATGRITLLKMQEVIDKYLSHNGYETQITEQLFHGMVERVVALVSRVQGTFEFEVQPLREYFAARYLYDTAPYSPPGEPRSGTKPDRFLALAPNLYWLNVTRFFAGCYTKGELPSLIDNLKELRERAEFTYLAHPRTLAAVLLSDWVFSQHPRSVRETVSLIFDRYGLHYVLADESERDSAQVVLGDKHARDELVVRCWSVLNDSPPPDFAFSVASLMRANSARRDTTRQWEESLRSASDKTRWLEYGLHLGHLPEVSKELLDEVVDVSNQAHIRLLARARQYTYLEASAHREETIRYVLEGCPYVWGRGEDTLLIGLAYALDLGRYSIGLYNPDPRPLNVRWARGRGPLPDPDALPSISGDSELSRRICTFLSVVRSETERPSTDWATLLAPWSVVVESGRKEFGDSWALYRMSAVAAGIRSAEEKAVGFDDPLDERYPLCSRARFARLRSGSETWWRQQLARDCASRISLRFLLLLCLRWATGRVLKALSDILSELLDNLSQDDWRSLYKACVDSGRGSDVASNREIDIENTPEKMSPRLATILILNASERGVRAIFTKHLRDAQSDDQIINAARINVAYRELLESQHWQRNLKVIREAYAAGAQSDRIVPHWFRREAKTKGMDPTLAATVCTNPELYPSQLLRAAERRLLEEAMKRVEPLHKIALRERWFDD